MEEQHMLAPHEEPVVTIHSPGRAWWRKYQYDLYDWDDPDFKKANRGKYAFRAIPLTQGYFMIVALRDYWRMTHFPNGRLKRWTVKIDRDKRTGDIMAVYARRNGRDTEPMTVYAHREVLGCLHQRGDGDHVNGEGLDNRRNLHYTNLLFVGRSQNTSNAIRVRSVHTDLMRGVEYRGKNRLGQDRFGGIRAVRLGKHRVKTIRTKRIWLTQEPAARWYQNQLKMLYPERTTWVHVRKSVHYAAFPPSINSEPAPIPRRKTRAKELEYAIPFF